MGRYVKANHGKPFIIVMNEPSIEDRYFRVIVQALEEFKEAFRNADQAKQAAQSEMKKAQAEAARLSRWFDGVAAATKSQSMLPVLSPRLPIPQDYRHSARG